MRISDLTNEPSIEEVNNDIVSKINKLKVVNENWTTMINAIGYDEAVRISLPALEIKLHHTAKFYAWWYKSTDKLISKFENELEILRTKINSGLNEQLSD